MEAGTLSVLAASGVAVAGTLLGAVVAGRMSRKTAHSAISLQAEVDHARASELRIWESRKNAYVGILGKLKDALGKAETVEWGIAELGAEEYFATQESQVETASTRAAWNACQAEFDLNEVVVSDAFAERFKALAACVPGVADWGYLLPPEIAGRELGCFRDAYPALLDLARSDVDPRDATGKGNHGAATETSGGGR